MEILSVQSRFQGRFGVTDSAKVKDWTSFLTSPLPFYHRQHQNENYCRSSSSDNSSRSNVKKVIRTRNVAAKNQNHSVDHQKQQQKPSSIAKNNNNDYVAIEASSNIDDLKSHRTNISRYNSNLISCGLDVNVVDAAKIKELSIRLQDELRAAKSRHLGCTEVSLPLDLTPRISVGIIEQSEKEPCGIRGCTIYIEFEDEPNNSRRIASLKIDSDTVSTFELYLTLRHDKSGWTSLLPQFIKNLTRSSSIVISPEFSLTKNKLYHSSSS